MPFVKGNKGNPLGRPSKASQLVVFNLKQAARGYCEEAIKVIARCMRSDDEKVALMAASIMLDRGYGKPEQRVDAEVTHRFAEVPQVMEKAQWLASRGDPNAPKLIEHEPDPTKKLN